VHCGTLALAIAVLLKAPDGTPLNATYYAAAGPGPGVILFHQSNRTRASWDDIAQKLAAAGIHTLTLDARAHDKVDVAFDYLTAQKDVDRHVIGAGGAGWLGVNFAVETARRHPADVKSIAMLSGETLRPQLQFLHDASSLPELYVFSDDDEYPPTEEAMQLLYATASTPYKKLVHFSKAEEAPWIWYETDSGKPPAHGGHGTDLFASHPELSDIVVQWFVTTLIKTPGHAPADPIAAAPILSDVEFGGGVARAAQQLADARKRDPEAQLWPEISMSIVGQDFMREGDLKSAIEILKLNLDAYRDSADAHETLAEAYLKDGQKELATKHAELALFILDSHSLPGSSWSDTLERNAEVRKGAQDVIDGAGAAPVVQHQTSIFRDCPVCPEMVVVRGGNFIMGSPAAEKSWAVSHGATIGSVSDEAPQHVVSLTSFAIAKYDVTRDEYAAFVRETGHPDGDGCGSNGFHWTKDPNRNWRNPGIAQKGRDPVVCVSWQDAQAYVQWLNHKTGGSYRLPSESEWEYAARAGAATPFWWGDDDAGADAHAWYKSNSGGKTHPVGQKPPNRFGLYDMAGNVWQWTEDCYASTYAGAPADGSANETPSDCMRVDRGGSWDFKAWLLRSATRERNPADYRDAVMGFRVAKTLHDVR